MRALTVCLSTTFDNMSGREPTHADNLVFPDGVRLARHWELPGPEQNRASNWAWIQAANITTGFILSESSDSQFAFYAEANVDAPKIWDVFNAIVTTVVAGLVAEHGCDPPR